MVDVLAATCVMGYRKQIKIKIWEWIVFVACGLFLLSQFVVFNYGMINDMINKRGEVLIVVIIEFLMFWMFIAIAVIWYFIYYQPKLKMRLASNLNYQNQLDQEFVPMIEEEAIKYLLNEPETENDYSFSYVLIININIFNYILKKLKSIIK